MAFHQLKKYLRCEKDGLYQLSGSSRGIACKQDIEVGTRIMKIPFNNMIQLSEIPFYPFMESLVHHKNSILAIYLAIQSTHPSSYLKTILKNMPRYESLGNFPYFLQPDQFQLLMKTSFKILMETTQFMEHCIEDYDTLKKNQHVIQEHVPFDKYPSFVEYLYFRIMATSRVFGYTRQFNHESALIPYADLLNHSNDPNTRWYFDDSSNCFIVESTRFIPAHQEILDTYGNRSNHVLYMYYGFTLENNHLPSNLYIFSETRARDKLNELIKFYPKVKDPNIKTLYKEDMRNLENLYPQLKKSRRL